MIPQLFNFEGQELRTVIKDSEPWFVGGDVCKVLELNNAPMALGRLDADEKDISSIDTLHSRSNPIHPQNRLILNVN